MPSTSPGPRLASVASTLLALALVGCKDAPRAPDALPFAVEKDAVRITAPGAIPFGFKTAKVTRAAPLPPSPVTGRVTTVESLTAPVVSPLGGRIVETRVRLGDVVKKGERLALVRTSELPDLERARQAAELGIRTKLAIVDRLSKLVEARAAAQGDLAVANAELDEARLSATAAAARLRALAVEVAGNDSFWLLAQRDGTVVQVDGSPGREVGPGHDPPVATVADLSELLVVSDVSTRDADALEPGMVADVGMPGSSRATLQATLERVSDVVDPDRQTVPVRLRLKPSREPAPSDGGSPPRAIRPNSFVSVRFLRRAGPDVVVVSSDAVVTEGAQSVVFVETEPGRYARRVVTIGRRTKEKTEIPVGLAPGERVVVEGALLLLNAIDLQG